MLKLKQIIPGVLAPLSFAMGSSVEAATVVNLDGDGNVVSISDLEICISSAEICAQAPEDLTENKVINFYNVNFPLGSFNDIFGNPTQPGFMGSCNNGLCFWGNQTQASLAITEMNNAINDMMPIPGDIAGEFTPPLPPPPFPPLDNRRNFYRIPLGFNGVSSITYIQGTNNNENPNSPWVLDTIDSNTLISNQLYADFEFVGQEIITPPTTPTVPEPSSLIGIVFMGGSALIAIKKKD